MAKITKRTVDALKPRAKDYFLWDGELAGFGVRVMKSGIATYVAQYRSNGRTRRFAFSRVTAMTPDEARKFAREIIVAVDKGRDPVAEIVAQRRTPTIAALCDRFMTEHVELRCKPSTTGDYRHLVENVIKKRLGTFKIDAVKRPDVAQLHHDLRDRPYQANRAVSVLSKMMNLAELWGLRADGSNPCRHVRRFTERKRERFLSFEEIERLGAVLNAAEADGSEPKSVITAYRLLILTGARLGEIQTLKWMYVRDGFLALPDSKTGAKRIMLGKEAIEVLRNAKRIADNPYVIVGEKPGQPWHDLERPWRRIREKAGLPDLRIHDLRHTFASVAAGEGESLPIIGKLLGHTQAQTTARYAHLANDVVAKTADRVADVIAAAMGPKRTHPDPANSNRPMPDVAAE